MSNNNNSRIFPLENASLFKTINSESWRHNAVFWSEHEHYRHKNLFKFTKKLENLLTQNTNANSHLLDVGCGSAWLSTLVNKQKNWSYTGLDIMDIHSFDLPSHDIIKDGQWRLICHDFEEINSCDSANDRKYDIAVFCLSLLEMPNLHLVWDQISNVIKDNGNVVILGLDKESELDYFMHSKNSQFSSLEKLLHVDKPLVIEKPLVFGQRTGASPYYRILYSNNEIIEAAEKTGFSLLNYEKITSTSTTNKARIISYDYLEFGIDI